MNNDRNSERNVYLDLKSIEQARAILFEQFGDLVMPTEIVDVVDADGRILAGPAVAAISSPNFHAAAMDGIAVDAKTTFGAAEDSPVILVPGENAFWVNTGHVLPGGCNAVIMIENLNIIDDTRVEIEAPAFPWQYVRKMGEDIVATELLFPRNQEITPYAMGALLAGGIFQVAVYKKPRVLIIPTGSELKQWQDITPAALAPGDVVESNSAVLGGLCRQYGAEFVIHPMLRDTLEGIQSAVREAVHGGTFDMICIIGGSSAGSRDFAKPVISALGEVFVHGVTMMPGKPVIFGKIENRPVFGIPGYPVSAIVAFEQFTGPLLSRMQKKRVKEEQYVTVHPARKMTSKLGQEEFLRVKIGSVDNRFIASPLPRGAGNITTLTEADGIIRIPRNAEGIGPDEAVRARLLRPLTAIENTVIIIGSHDNTLDLLADQVRRISDTVSISSSHVGSLGGLMAIKSGTCHMAGAHLLDPADGSYNISYINKYLPDEAVVVVNLVMRDQGLIVAKGNPKGISGLEDFRSGKLQFINRQPGAGTRILTDYRLNQAGISPNDIAGYANEEYTHMSVAVAVMSGRADAGMGIHAAAKALSLDFLPVITEEYDLVIPRRFYETDKVRALIDTIRTDGFKARVQAMGGYATGQTGQVMYEN